MERDFRTYILNDLQYATTDITLMLKNNGMKVDQFYKLVKWHDKCVDLKGVYFEKECQVCLSVV